MLGVMGDEQQSDNPQTPSPNLTEDRLDHERAAGNDNDLDPEYFNPLADSTLDDTDRDAAQAAQLRAALRALDQPDESSSRSGDAAADGDADEELAASRIDSIKLTQDFIKEIQHATLDNGNLDEDLVHRLRNPCEQPADISNPDIRLSLDLFMAVTNAAPLIAGQK